MDKVQLWDLRSPDRFWKGMKWWARSLISSHCSGCFKKKRGGFFILFSGSIKLSRSTELEIKTNVKVKPPSSTETIKEQTNFLNHTRKAININRAKTSSFLFIYRYIFYFLFFLFFSLPIPFSDISESLRYSLVITPGSKGMSNGKNPEGFKIIQL